VLSRAPIFRLFTVFAVVLASSLLTIAGTAIAQSQVWIQVEAQNNIRDTKSRAQFYAAYLPGVRAFQTPTGWYAIVIGPFTEDDAGEQVSRLKSQNRIPGDSFIADGNNFGSQLWPISAENEPGVITVVTSEEMDGSRGSDAEAETATDSAAGSDMDTDTSEPETETSNKDAEEPATPDVVEILPIPDRDLSGTKRAESRWSRDLKKQYQTYLQWTGDYEAKIDGAYGRGTRAAIRSFQEREGYEPTGWLTTGQTMILAQRYRDMRARLGIELLTSEEAGLEMPYPARLVTRDRVEPPFIYYESQTDLPVRMVLISQEGGPEMMDSLYEIMETFDYVPAEGYRARQRNWFVLSGHDKNIVSYSYVRTDNGKVKGFSLIWPTAQDKVMRRFVQEMFEQFTVLDDFVLDDAVGYGDDPDEPTDLSKGLDIETPDYSATGFFVNDQGYLITNTANIVGCKRLTVADGVKVELVARNPGQEIALLKPVKGFSPAGFALFSDETPRDGNEVTVAGFSFPEVMEVATLNFGTIAEDPEALANERELRLSAFIEPGDYGGPVLDDRGAVIGMQLQKRDLEDQPEYVNFALRAALLRDMLDRHSVAYSLTNAFDSADAVDIAFMAGDFTAKVSCWR